MLGEAESEWIVRRVRKGMHKHKLRSDTLNGSSYLQMRAKENKRFKEAHHKKHTYTVFNETS